MAAKQPKPAVDPKIEGDQPQNSGDAPASAYPNSDVKDNGAGAGREPQVAKEDAKSFDERTGVGTDPWLNEDGTQNTGAEDVATEAPKE